MASINIITLGCKVNQYESEWMKERLYEEGHEIVPFYFDADIVVVNTCTVTSESDRKSRQLARKIKRSNPKARIVVLGCSSQLNQNSFTEFDFVGGNDEKKKIIEIVEKLIKNSSKISNEVTKEYYLYDKLDEMVINGFEDRTRAFVKVEDGCDQFCTYCAIRKARGNIVRSKSPEIVEREVSELVNKNYREIVITGINLGRYGKDLGTNLKEILKRLLKFEGEFRLRLSSINPDDIDDELIELFNLYPEKLCRHLHISLQNGSDKVLKAMGRRYSIDEFIDIVYKLRKLDPLFSITTDIIVGFPTETDEDFEQTLQLCSFVKFSKIHIFRFSPRKGTPAYELWKKQKVPEKVVKERSKLLEEHMKAIRDSYLREHLGKIRKVLVEKTSQENNNFLSIGFDEYYIPHFINAKLSENNFVKSIPISVIEEGVMSRVACECEWAMDRTRTGEYFHIQ